MLPLHEGISSDILECANILEIWQYEVQMIIFKYFIIVYYFIFNQNSLTVMWEHKKLSLDPEFASIPCS